MWAALKGLGDWHSQVVIAAFIVDFLHAPTSTIVEIDGGYHLEPAQVVNDAARSRELSRRGYTVIRFSNGDVTNRIAEVMDRLSAVTCHRAKIATDAPLRVLPPPPNGRNAKTTDKVVKRWNGREYVKAKAKPDVCSARIPPRR
jgi:very-short-patch-repair endonuclease